MHREQSQHLYEEAKQYLVGGVNSPVRAFRAVGGEPLFIKRGRGSKITDADGNEFIDYVGSWGPLILGHAHPKVVAALKETIEGGTSFGAPTERETYLAKLITQAMPAVEMVRFVNSGTEATMSAIRLARAFTNRRKVVKFDGCYHGHSDSFLVKAGSGVMTLGAPDSPGVPPEVTQNTLSAPYNDLEAVEQFFKAFSEEIAAIIVEPVAANMGVIPPKQGFLEGLERLARDNGALLIFDEVITGFRLSYGGAQGLYGIKPDITCLGKIIGGGLPAAVYGGRREIMELLAPVGLVYQAGTLSGNPLAMAAGIATLEELAKPGVYEGLEQKSARLAAGLEQAAGEAGVPVYQTRVGSLLTTFFTQGEVINYQTAKAADTQRYAAYFWAMLEEGVYLAPSQFEAAFVSVAHTEADIEATISAAYRALRRIKEA